MAHKSAFLRAPDKLPSVTPTASVVILTKNPGPPFGEVLDAIAAQRTDFPYELVVVDSGSTDGTKQLLRRYPLRLREIPPEQFNFGLTRNLAFSLARGQYIVTISQDVTPCDREWLRRITAPFSRSERVAAVQGATIAPERADVFYWERTDGHFYFTREVTKWLARHPGNLSFTNCAVRRSFWLAHQLVYTPFSEDKLFQKMIHDAGLEIIVAPDALCYHGHQYTLRSLATRLFGEGVGWRYAGLHYSLSECLLDIYHHKWMLRRGLEAYRAGELKTLPELLFPILRPLLLYCGNNFRE